MKKKVLLFIVLVLIIIGVALVIGGTAPEGSSYHINTYTNTISGASTDTIVVNDKIDMQEGLIIETCNSATSGDCPTASTAVTGQIWLETTANTQT
jgi:dihydroxyacid dehydratase/phosphogluconate dehydratase